MLDAAQIAGSGALHRRVPLRRVGPRRPSSEGDAPIPRVHDTSMTHPTGRAGRRVARAVGRRVAQLQGAGRNGARRRARHGLHQAATKLRLLLERVLRRSQRKSPYAQPINQFFRPARGGRGSQLILRAAGWILSIARWLLSGPHRHQEAERAFSPHSSHQQSAICINLRKA